MLQVTGIADWAQEMHVAPALRDNGHIAFLRSRLAEMGSTSTSRGGGGAPRYSQQQVRGRAPAAQLNRNCPREGFSPGNPD